MGKTKKKDDQPELKYFDRAAKVFNSESGVQHQVFVDVLDEQRVNELTPKGTRVLVARYPDFYKIYLVKYMIEGTSGFPRGGIKVWNTNYDQTQSFYFESVAIHPEGGTYKIYDAED